MQHEVSLDNLTYKMHLGHTRQKKYELENQVQSNMWSMKLKQFFHKTELKPSIYEHTCSNKKTLKLMLYFNKLILLIYIRTLRLLWHVPLGLMRWHFVERLWKWRHCSRSGVILWRPSLYFSGMLFCLHINKNWEPKHCIQASIWCRMD